MQHFSPIEYLKIDVASAFGLDRADWSERLDWFESNKHQLKLLVNQAKEPALFFAAAEAYETTERGQPTGHMVSLDATASGIQILAVISGDASAARHCNVLNTGHRQDAYTNIHDLMHEVCDFAQIDRKETKYALMTTLYGSEAVPKQVFGEGALLDVFETVAEREMPAVWALNKALLRCWNPNALDYQWVLPDNFHVVTKVMGSSYQSVNFMGQTVDIHKQVNMAQPEGRSIGANVTHSLDGYIVREMMRRCSYDPAVIADLKVALRLGKGTGSNRHKDRMVKTLWDLSKKFGILSARIFDYLDMDNMDLIDDRQRVLDLIATLPAKPFWMLANHDCFRVHPNNAGAMRLQYNRQLMELSVGTPLNAIASQLLGVEVNTQKLDYLDPAEILAANYALS